MRNFTRLLAMASCIAFSSYSATAQKQIDRRQGLELVRKNASAMLLTKEDVDNSIVSNAYTTADGINMVYLQQAYKGISVFNQIQTAAFKDEKNVSLAGERIADIAAKVNEPSGTPVVNPQSAIQKAAAALNIAPPATFQFAAIPGEENNILRFTPSNISQQEITVQLLWVPAGKNKLLLCRQVYIAPIHSSDYWLIQVDALNGEIINKINLTVSCNWNKPSAVNSVCNLNDNTVADSFQQPGDASPLAINSANYRVVPYPAESPIHPGGSHAIRFNPWAAAPGNATSLKWNNDGTLDYRFTRGNNVFAHEDRLNFNNNNGASDTSSTAVPDLNFVQAPDFAQAATVRINQRFGTTNLFYWNNVMHDISYVYGFDEPSGNFQASNQGRGGAGNDYVQADAQDGLGTNNANFGTPADGGQPRMQMYLFTYGTPGKDGDLDNGVISHEYTHGISNRLTGGPANVACLDNPEQMGEGWSDYVALMVTTNWATATTSDGPLRRPIGNYVLNMPVTGAGIRNYPYSTNMTINPLTYAILPTLGGEEHNIGEVWCAMLWDMTWNVIGIDGINTNFYNASGVGGNSAAMKLVTEGMRLQPCSPGFVDGRNAILKADTLFFGAKYSCAIWDAFARRGLGLYASQGSSQNPNDGVADYTSPNGFTNGPYSANKPSAGLNETISYTTQVTTGACGGVTNFFITDTLPANVNYVSGGSYNSTNRTITFSPITQPAATTSSYTATVRVKTDAYYAPVIYINETVPTATIAATWTTSPAAPAASWATATTQNHSPAYSFFATDPAVVTDKILATTNAYNIISNTKLSFWHFYNTEATFDGGVVEISTNGGTAWTDLGSFIETNGYNGMISASYSNPIAGRRAFTGNSGGFINTIVNLNSFAGQSIKIRFRLGTDNAVAATGWYVDDIEMKSTPVVINKMTVFNAGGTQVSAKTINTPVTANVVPVNWGEFYAQKKQQTSLLTWSTMQEFNVANFIIERSADGISFAPLATVAARGNSNTRMSYRYVDEHPLKGSNYYRISERDVDGRDDLSIVRNVNFASLAEQITIAPNPAKDIVKVSLSGNTDLLLIRILNSVGQEVKSFTMRNQSGLYDVSGLARGIYYVRITGSEQTVVKKLVVE